MEQLMPRKRNYLNNRDILKQIHLSKNTYCTFIDKDNDNMYDLILEDADRINIRTLKEARENQAARLTKNLKEIDKTATPIDPKDITNQDIVIRVMTTEHIPLVPKRKQKPEKKTDMESINDIFQIVDPDLTPANVKYKAADDINITADSISMDDIFITEDGEIIYAADIEMTPMRAGFPPFFHYRIDENKQPYIVGKSHWKGDLETGQFCKDHGRVTNELANMFLKITERYSSRGNWRGYTYVDEMRGQALVQLSQVGLQFNELKSQNPFSYFSAILGNSFTRVLNNEKKMQNIRDDILEENGLEPSWTRQLAYDTAIELNRKARIQKSKDELDSEMDDELDSEIDTTCED